MAQDEGNESIFLKFVSREPGVVSQVLSEVLTDKTIINIAKGNEAAQVDTDRQIRLLHQAVKESLAGAKTILESDATAKNDPLFHTVEAGKLVRELMRYIDASKALVTRVSNVNDNKT